MRRELTITGERIAYQVIVESEGAEFRVLSAMLEDDVWKEHHRGHDIKLAVYVALRKSSEIEGTSL